jgi:hypothetical protein
LIESGNSNRGLEDPVFLHLEIDAFQKPVKMRRRVDKSGREEWISY